MAPPVAVLPPTPAVVEVPPPVTPVKPLPDVKGDEQVVEGVPEMTFTFVEGRESGNAQQDYLYGQTGEVQQITVDELREYFESDEVNRLSEQFGDFDNYLAYMTEREQLIQSGDYDVGNWSEADTGFTEDQQMIFEGDADLTIDASDPGQDITNLNRQVRNTQAGAYNNWLNSEANQALLEKYGVSGTVYSESGDKFQWNGSAYVKVVDEDKVSMGDYARMAMGVAVGSVLGPALGNLATGVTTAGTTAASGAAAAAGTTTAAAATTAGTFVQGAVNATLGSALTQGIATGSIDAKELATAAITGGIGGVADGIQAGELTGTAASNAIDEIANVTGLTTAQTVDVVEGVLNGVVTGEDVEGIVIDAVQGFTESQVKNVINDMYGDEIDVENVFDEGTTTIPTEALNPIIDTAVNAAFEGELEVEDVVKSLIDYSQEGGSFAFLDPGIGLPSIDVPDADLFGDLGFIEDAIRDVGRETEDVVRLVGSEIDDEVIQPIRELLPEETPEVIKEIEDVVRAVGSETEDVVRLVGSEVDDEIIQPIRDLIPEETPEVIKEIEDVIRTVGSETEDVVRLVGSEIDDVVIQPIREAIPHGTTPELDPINIAMPDVNLPSVDLPSIDVPSVDLPSVDLPSINLEMPQIAGGGGMFDPYTTNIGYSPVQLQQLITSPYNTQPALKDYDLAINGVLARNSGMLS